LPNENNNKQVMASSTPARRLPNIIITGTPGVGKTSHCEALAERSGELGLGLRHVSVNQVVKDKQCHEGWDDEYQSWVVDEDKVSLFSFSILLPSLSVDLPILRSFPGEMRTTLFAHVMH